MEGNIDLKKLDTEQANNALENIDELDALSIVKLINEQDKIVANAIEPALPQIAIAAEAISKRFLQGGRIVYIGAGSSGRIGVIDAVELNPTYSVSNERAFGILAGGVDAMYEAIEGVEDSVEQGAKDIEDANIQELDVVIGIAASGRTPYTVSALKTAQSKGAYTIGITNTKDSELSKVSNSIIEVIVGPEVITGSTRMKAGTSQKLVANMLSTTSMILSGKVYKNYMVHVQATNQKLVKRSINIVSQLTGLNEEDAADLFEKSQENVAAAVVMSLANVSFVEANEALDMHHGNVRKAISELEDRK